jgi:hypothetical protein
MTIPVWPSDLPDRFLQDGYSESFPDGRLRTPTDAGPGKVRKRFRRAVRPVSAQMLLTVDQLVILNRFWDEDTGGGSLVFAVPAQTLDGLPLAGPDGVLLVSPDDTTILVSSWWLARFGDNAPVVTPVSGSLYRVGFPLTVMPD